MTCIWIDTKHNALVTSIGNFWSLDLPYLMFICVFQRVEALILSTVTLFSNVFSASVLMSQNTAVYKKTGVVSICSHYNYPKTIQVMIFWLKNSIIEPNTIWVWFALIYFSALGLAFVWQIFPLSAQQSAGAVISSQLAAFYCAIKVWLLSIHCLLAF